MDGFEATGIKTGTTHPLTVIAIDLETLSRRYDALIWEVGIAVVQENAVSCKQLDVNAQIEKPEGHVERDTVDWTANLKRAEEPKNTVIWEWGNVFNYLVQINKNLPHAYWACQNPEFDFGMLRYRAAQIGEERAFYNFRKILDLRTMENIGQAPSIKETKPHIAVEDARIEALLAFDVISNALQV